jgi:hypothetical protein
MSTELLPRSVAEAEGPAYWFLKSLNIVKTTSDSTGGAFSMVYHTAPLGHATPHHLHHIEDEVTLQIFQHKGIFLQVKQ